MFGSNVPGPIFYSRGVEEEKNGIYFKMMIQKVMMHTFNNELDEMKRLSTNIEDFNRV